uniref:uncharacterized protein LOC122586637 n=1 Tax=Erigeron canadensis TaxID=72917 RepID=UPI001CB9AE45|nr:uncharacterized protein LOC122586637 [Erigeron canadensis]
MKCADDIKTYAKIRSDKKLFQFLNRLDRKFDAIKREILRNEPIPTVEVAYAIVRKEAAHQKILGATTLEPQGVAAGLIAREINVGGFVSKGYRRYDTKKKEIKDDKSDLLCDECGMSRHTKEQCFRLVGYPDWWIDGNKKGTKSLKSDKGKTSVSVTDHNKASSSGGRRSEGYGGMAESGREEKGEGDESSFSVVKGKREDICFQKITYLPYMYRPTPNSPMPNYLCHGPKKQNGPSLFSYGLNNEEIKSPMFFDGSAYTARNHSTDSNGPWIFDCGATDTMTYELSDFSKISKARKTHIKAANKGKMDVKTGGTIKISLHIKLSNCLYVPISGRDGLLGVALRERLDYVDEVNASGNVMLAHGTSEREAWLWHRRLGHPSSIKIVRSDNGGEYKNSQMSLFFQSKGIVHQTTCPHTPEQNGVAEHSNTTVDLDSSQEAQSSIEESSQEQNSVTKDISPNLISESEVRNSSENVTIETVVPDSNESMLENEEQVDEEPNDEESVDTEVPRKYVLPTRSTRRIPAKRYSPE